MNDDMARHAVDFAQAADWLAQADGLLITTGAGMGVDSGLPDFRGTEGFWRAYPALAAAAAVVRGDRQPWPFCARSSSWPGGSTATVWPFTGVPYRTKGLRSFAALRQTWNTARSSSPATSTAVRQGRFCPDRICEVHGSIHHLQCCKPCCDAIWPADDFVPDVDASACRLLNAPPRCPVCGGMARPNILMFGDWRGWQPVRKHSSVGSISGGKGGRASVGDRNRCRTRGADGALVRRVTRRSAHSRQSCLPGGGVGAGSQRAARGRWRR